MQVASFQEIVRKSFVPAQKWGTNERSFSTPLRQFFAPINQLLVDPNVNKF